MQCSRGRSHKSRVEENHLTYPAGHASFDATQGMVDFLNCKHTLPAHVELLIKKTHPGWLMSRGRI